jgi:hypothetical protein
MKLAQVTRRCSPLTVLATGNRPASRCDSLAKRANSTVDIVTRITTTTRGNVALTRSALGKINLCSGSLLQWLTNLRS